MKQTIFLLLFWVNILGAHANYIVDSVKWDTFLSRHDLVWGRIPTDYFNAPFLGNGLLGAMLYQPPGEMLRLDIGSSEVLERRNTVAQSIVDNGRLPIGYFEFATNYHIIDATGRLDIYNAEARFKLKMYKGQPIDMSVKVLRNTDLIVLNYRLPEDLQGYWIYRSIPSVVPRQGPSKGVNYLNSPAVQQIVKGVNLSIQKRDAGGDYVTAWKDIQLADGSRRLLVTVRDDYPENTDLDSVVSFLNEHEKEALMEDAFKAHKNWWNKYYTKSFVSIPHPQMESLYWGLQYKLASMMRKGAPLCDLMGPWYKQTAWPGVWFNLNTQMLFSSLHISNQQELVSTMSDYIHDNEQNLINSVPEEFRYNAAGLPRCSGRDQIDPAFEYPNSEYPERSNLIYLMYYLWEHYRMTMDDNYLGKQYYPLLKRAVNFLLNVLEEDAEGKIHTPKAHSPEAINDSDTNYDLSSLRWGCETLLEINQRLNLKDKQQKEWQKVLKHLLPFPTDQNGFMASAHRSAPLGHRHWCHLFQIYPYYLINVDQPENQDIIMRSLKHWGDPKIPNTWTQAVISSMYSSMKQGDKALEHLNYALATKNLSRNFMHSEDENPCSETYGGLSRMLLDMLIQSWGGKIRIFPGVSQEWKQAIFHQLRAEGGFIVSANRKNGRTEWIEIESVAGEPCILQHGFSTDFKVAGARMKKIDESSCRLYLKKGEKALLYIGDADKVVSPIVIAQGQYNFYGLPGSSK